MTRKIAILGSTGSIGQNALWVAERLQDDIDVIGVAAGRKTDRVRKQAYKFGCNYAAVAEETFSQEFSNGLPSGCKALCGVDGMVEMATAPEVDTVLCAVVGTAGLRPVIAAIKAGKNIALASKEILVMAGEAVTKTAAENGVKILPVDSEHAAVFQCLQGHDLEEVSRIILTASGGPFRDTPIEVMQEASYENALAHPTWNMGPKITIDSATMMNKALELIEAKWLFDFPPDKLDVLVHPQSIVHSLIELTDGGMLAHLGQPDMRQPIQYALTYPERCDTGLPRCNLAAVGNLTFENVDDAKFPAVELARQALRAGGTMPAVLNAANEAAVELFRAGKIKFPEIAHAVDSAMKNHKNMDSEDLDTILDADKWARDFVDQQFS